MWLFTVHGFYSIVQKTDETFHIRSRHKRDLMNLKDLAALKTAPVKSHAGSDYPWRIIATREEKDRAIQALGRDIEYGNFKSAVATEPDQAGKLSAYHEVWSVMRQTQPLEP